MARLAKGMRKREDGTFEKRFMVDGKRYSVYGHTAKECTEKELAKRQALKEHAYIKNGSITLDKYFEEWAAQKENSVSTNTMRSYRSLYHSRISPTLGKRKVKDIERREVLKLQTNIYKDSTKNTTNRVMNILHQLMKAAELDGIVIRNVCTSVQGVKNKDTDKPARDTKHRALTREEITTFLKYAKDSWYYNVFRLMLATGMRAGEVCGLEWKDIDPKNNVIHVRRTITKGADGKNTIGKTTKTETSTRNIPLNAESRAVLDDMRANRKGRDSTNVCHMDGLIVHSERGTIANAVNVTMSLLYVLNRAAKNGEPLKRFTSHAFRATFASKCIEQGVAPNTLKEIMGHASLAMTMDLYGHVYEDQKQEAMKHISIING